MRFLLTLFSCVFWLVTYSQVPDTVKADSTIFIDPETSPTYPDGWHKYKDYLDSNFQWKPDSRTIEGRVYVEFFVETGGTISEAKVLRGLSESCNREAFRLKMGMPKWKPGTWHGKPKRTKMVMPVVFKL